MSARLASQGQFLTTAAALVRRRTGLVFSEARRADFERALLNAMERAATPDPDAYLARLEGEPRLLDDLVADITVGETYFLREPEQFAVIRDEILPDLLAHRAQNQPVRVWSAGCASGEEPYSLAILLSESGRLPKAHILGTDISRAALTRARQARYTRWSLRGVPDNVVRAHFTERGGQFLLTPAVRAAVEFGYLNLAEDVYPSLSTGVWGMDLILCRNVLIYFDRDTVAQVAQRLFDSLAEGGWLLLGASDPPLADLIPAEVVVTRAGLAYRRGIRSRASPVAQAPAPPALAETLLEPLRPVAAPIPSEPEAVTIPLADEVLVRYSERDYRSAARLAERAVAHEDGDPRLWVLWVRALANQGDLSSAGRACAAGLDRHGTCAELTYLHAILLGEGGHPAEAARAARAALYLDRHLAVAHLTLGAALVKLGDTAGARRSFRNAERLLAAMPSDAVVPASDGEPPARLAEMVRLQLRLLAEDGPG